MDVRAILVVTPPEPPSGECFAGVPLALADIVGKSLVEHTCDRLGRFADVAVQAANLFRHNVPQLKLPNSRRIHHIAAHGERNE